MHDKRKFNSPKAPKNRKEMDMDFDSTKSRNQAKDPKYKHAKYWLSQEDDDEEDYDINAIFGKDEEE